MTPERREPLDDEALDQAIRNTLAVEPSPAFQARVRERIAQEPMKAGWNWTWGVAGLAAAAGLAALVAFVSLSSRKTTPPDVIATAPAPAPVVSQPAPTTPPLVAEPAAAQSTPNVAVELILRTVSAEPEILIDRREVAAFRQLLDSLDPSRIDFKSLQKDIPPATDPLPVVAQLSIEPVVVTALN